MKSNLEMSSNIFSCFIFFEKLINLLTRDGKKTKASKIFYDTLELLRQKQDKKNEKNISPTEIVEIAITNCMPSLEVRKVRVAGTTYLVPAMIAKKKQEALAMRWIVEAAHKKKKSTKLNFAQCLADEIYDAFLRQGYARTKRNELHRLAEANRAYIRYRWW